MKTIFRFLSIGLVFAHQVVMGQIPQIMNPYSIQEMSAVAERVVQTVYSEMSNDNDEDIQTNLFNTLMWNKQFKPTQN